MTRIPKKQNAKRRSGKPSAPPSLCIRVRCGCGQSYILRKLDAESECDNCRWPIVWASGSKGGLVNEWTLSRHISMTITREA